MNLSERVIEHDFYFANFGCQVMNGKTLMKSLQIQSLPSSRPGTSSGVVAEPKYNYLKALFILMLHALQSLV